MTGRRTRALRDPDPIGELARTVLRGSRELGVPEDARVVLAVSGGPDSMALLVGSAAVVARSDTRWRLHVGHLDHALRPSSARDAAFVTAAADRLGVLAAVQRVDVAMVSRDAGRSLEEAGREARYHFLEELAGDDGWIATGHTADDAAETVLLNLLRGAGLAGARGIPARRGRIVRPLLGERRAALRALLDEAAEPYLLDTSNDDAAFLRNRVRHELMPLLEDLRSGAVERLVSFASLASDDDALLDTLAAEQLRQRRRPDGSLDWRDPPPIALGRRVLRLAIGEPAPSAERVEAILEAAVGPHGGLRIELGGGRSASVRGRRIRIDGVTV